MSGVDVQALDDLLRAARFYCDREGCDNRSNYATDMLERGEKSIAAVSELATSLEWALDRIRAAGLGEGEQFAAAEAVLVKAVHS